MGTDTIFYCWGLAGFGELDWECSGYGVSGGGSSLVADREDALNVDVDVWCAGSRISMSTSNETKIKKGERENNR